MDDYRTERGGNGQETTFLKLNKRTGAAGSRGFHQLMRLRGRQEALDSVERGARETVNQRRFPETRGLDMFDVVVEHILLGAGVPEAQVPPLARIYRAGKEPADSVYDR